MNTRTASLNLFFLTLLTVSAHNNNKKWDMNMFANMSVNQLEQMYIDDCETDTSPHGYYGAFLQPCEFQFRQSKLPTESGVEDGGDACSDANSLLIDRPVPMHWIFNSTFLDEGFSSDDIPSAEELLLWPDQCVGVTPRCYSVDDEAIHLTLTRIFEGGIPDGATHVRVDCRADALAISRAIDSFAENFDKFSHDFETTLPLLIGGIVTVVLAALVLGMWSIYACLRLCCFRDREADSRKFHRYPAGEETPPVVLTGSEYEVIEEGTEKQGLLAGQVVIN